ncbi:RDD family protein [Vibrio parahaemolyticus]|uniref:RDD family protein n=1 Tax=Vibrio parahaemolyticus TaxID=670 RepID=UPI00287884D4|nr:RDD family protein [Vibrio parahaemolyticus]EHK9182019.1 RDD family protein [Vibrio parahaemolyticus]EJG1621182.1 RDD family protein [Vibrio parahaemolyticus]MDS1796881.1 RDD family protein [Vibrio parahaemolyticus]MDS1944864.1 RDD family protein [Vibrio parahaemolyticus]
MFFRRAVAYLIDLVVPMLFGVAFLWFFTDLRELFIEKATNPNDHSAYEKYQDFRYVARAMVTFLCMVYCVTFECFLTLNTPGKKLLGIRVVSQNGSNMTLKQSIGRNFQKFFEPFFLLVSIVYSILNRNQMFLHDKWSSTKVIRIKD